MRLARSASGLALCAILAGASGSVLAQATGNASPNPAAILAEAKAASGGAAWDAQTVQHTRVSILAGGIAGTAERWCERATGRSRLHFSLGALSGTLGYDGSLAWAQDASGPSRIESADTARELAANAAYRDRLAFWFPARQAAAIRYERRAVADGADFDVVAVTPAGGREFELWVNAETKLIERLVEPEAVATRTEIYMDWRDVQGVKIPFRVRTSRGNPKYDEVIAVDAMEFNGSLAGVDFARPGPAQPEFTFPAGKTLVELPFEVVNGHIYVRVGLNGKGPFLMLFDSGGINALVPEAAQALGLAVEGTVPAPGIGERREELRFARVGRMEVAGIAIDSQVFAIVPLTDFIRRVEGLDAVAGLVGYELLKRFPLLIDYTRSRIVIYEPSKFSYAGAGVRVPLRFKGRVPQVQGSVDGIDGTFEIDTGSRSALTLGAPFARQHGLAAKIGATQEVIASAGPGGHLRALLGRAGTLRLGDVATYNPVTYLSTATEGAFADPALAGNVGYATLRRFNITFDYAHEALYFERNANYGQPDVHDRAGLWVERGDKGYVLVEVVPRGPAAQAGCKAGDVVVAIDGKPPNAVPLAQFRLRLKGPPGTKIRLRLQDGTTHVLTLRDLV